ncbi:hypothetical protein CERSUDRAFT_149984 [Gelatoporia subvermispora B]|uniref:Geranylgeranyl pyrophosphate synthetase n=1 Tax=Ceriporiopsis subvermispora (strain B) TaxID=914234 RepID=M2RLZ8_CERS8|nr:hypothetical protein CERSUDRAFT_149984 [Gelatoporia subvermispora B]
MSYRSYSRARGYRSSNYNETRTSSALLLPPDRDILEGLGSSPLQELQRPEASGYKDIKLKDFQYIGSYNWTNSNAPTIIVPGSPPEWRDRTPPFSVPRDSGPRFVDQNGYRMPQLPLLPLFRAVDVIAEEEATDTFDWSTVDFVTDRNSLRKLLRWIQNNDGSTKEFRIDTQLAGKRTVLLNRWEKRTRENADLSIFTYGISFERENTTPAPGCEGSSGHHRVVQYDFDGLKLVVRFEVDACIAAPRATQRQPKPSTSVDDLSNILSGMGVSGSAGANVAADVTKDIATELSVIRAGTEVPQSSLVEMTTRSKNWVHTFDWADAYPQLFLSQTSNHFLAAHARGRFESITKRQVGSPEMKQIEASIQPAFRRLRQALHDIQELVKAHGQRGRLTLVCREGRLEIFERESQESCLPDSVMERFDI